MRKAIYLETSIELTPEGSVVSGASDVDYGSMLQDTLRASKAIWSEQSHLSVEVKRVRAEKSSPPRLHFSMLLYLEGEQDAPQNFVSLTTEHLQKLLEQIASQLLAHHVVMKIERIEE